jgi:hypothetical protein
LFAVIGTSSAVLPAIPDGFPLNKLLIALCAKPSVALFFFFLARFSAARACFSSSYNYIK